jgi:hypothetical protein
MGRGYNFMGRGGAPLRLKQSVSVWATSVLKAGTKTWREQMDPITLLAAASAVWNGIKKASEFAQEAEGVWSQLSKYVGYADQLEQHITDAKNKPAKPQVVR